MKKALWLLLAFQLSFLFIVHQAFADKTPDRTEFGRKPTSYKKEIQKNHYNMTPQIVVLIKKFEKTGNNTFSQY